MSKTPEERRAYSRAYYAKNREKIRRQVSRIERVEARKLYNIEYVKANREGARERSRRYEAANSDVVSARKREWFSNNPGYLREYYLKHARRALLNQCRVRAKRRGIPCSISIEDIVVPALCPVLGIPIFHRSGRGMIHNSPSVDRVVPELGYVKGNVVVISLRANVLKRDASLDELMRVAEYVQRETARVERELLGKVA